MLRDILYDEFCTRNSQLFICVVFLFHSKETSSLLPDREHESRRFIHLFRRRASVVLPSHARDWPRQHILPLRSDSQVVIWHGENLVGKTTVMLIITVARK
jgi:hypothetical protein